MDPYSLGISEAGEATSHPLSPPSFPSFDHDLPLWMARPVEVLPGQVDGEIVYVTPAMDRLYGYRWPDTLLGQRIAEIHLDQDAQITRQYAVLRFVGYAMPQHYVMHARHPNGRIFRVVKHVEPYHPGPLITWVTHHERWQRRTPYPSLVPPQVPPWLRQVMAHLGAARPPTPPEPVTVPSLGTLLRQARQAHGLSQQALAQRCTPLLGQHITPRHVSSLERGQRLPSLPLLQVLVLVLKLDPTAVLTAQLETKATTTYARPLVSHTHDLGLSGSQDLLARVQQAAYHLAEAQEAHHTALVAARQAGASWRQLATATGRSPSRIRQLLARTPGSAAPTSPVVRSPDEA